MSQDTGGSNPSLSATYRICRGLEKYPSGRRGSPAKGVVLDNGSESSNLSFSAIETLDFSRVSLFYATIMPQPAQREAMNDSIFDTLSFCIVIEKCTYLSIVNATVA